jgi:hypothetical protein
MDMMSWDRPTRSTGCCVGMEQCGWMCTVSNDANGTKSGFSEFDM